MQRQDELLIKTILKMAHVLLHSRFRNWAAFIRNMDALNIQAERRRGVMRSVMLRMMKAQLNAGMSGWKHAVVSMNHQYELMRRVLGRLANANTSMAFYRWLSQLAEEDRVRLVLTNFIKKMINMQLYSPWVAWCAVVQHFKRQDELLSGAIASMSRALESSASRVALLSVAACLSRWRQAGAEASHAESLGAERRRARTWEDAKSQHNGRLLARAVHKMANAKLSQVVRRT